MMDRYSVHTYDNVKAFAWMWQEVYEKMLISHGYFISERGRTMTRHDSKKIISYRQ